MGLIGWVWNTFKSFYSSFLAQQVNVPPLVVFLGFAYAHLYQPSRPEPDYKLLAFFVGVALACTLNFNFLFLLTPFVGQPSHLAWPMFLVCAFSCNTKWKAELFLFMSGVSYLQDPLMQSLFAVFGSLFICSEVWRGMLFDTWPNNAQYFSGLTALAMYYTFKALDHANLVHMNPILTAFVSIFALFLGNKIIDLKIVSILTQQPQDIRSLRILALYLAEISHVDYPEIKKRAKMSIHKNTCHKQMCFCKGANNEDYGAFIKSSFDNAFRDFHIGNDLLLVERYVWQLVHADEIPRALFLLSEIRVTGFFSWNSMMRMERWLELYLNDKSSSLTYEKAYHMAIEYDRMLNDLAHQISRIMYEKMLFWREIIVQRPQMKELQRIGYLIVNKMYQLNNFFNYDIKRLEKVLNSYEGTIIYATYLMTTTNFRDYTDELMKQITTHMEKTQISDHKEAETFSIHVHAVARDKYHGPSVHNHGLQPTYQAEKNFEGVGQNFMMVIDSVSSGFCKELKLDKKDVVGSQLHSIVPDGYKKAHEARMEYVLGYTSDSNQGPLQPSKFLHNEVKLPVAGYKGLLMNGLICIKYLVDISKGLMLMSTIKKCMQTKRYCMINLDGQLQQSEQGIQNDLLKHSQFVKYRQKAKQEWMEKKTITQERFHVMINRQSYGVTLSSPLTIIFLEKTSIKDEHPPLHVEIESQAYSQGYKKGVKGKKESRAKQLQNNIAQQQSSIGTMSESRSMSAVSVTSNFVTQSYLSQYKYIFIAFVAVVVTCLLALLFSFFLTGIKWDNTKLDNNPIMDILYSLQLTSNLFKGANLAPDVRYYLMNQSQLNVTRINNYYGTNDYPTAAKQILARYSDDYNDGLRNLLWKKSQILTPDLEDLHNRRLAITEIGVNASAIVLPTQTIDFFDMVFNYGVDLKLFSKGQMDLGVLIFPTYNGNTANFLNTTSFIDKVKDSLDTSWKLNILLSCSVIGMVVIFTFVLGWTLSKRKDLHIRVFDIIASLDASIVHQNILYLQKTRKEFINSSSKGQRRKTSLQNLNEASLALQKLATTPTNKKTGGKSGRRLGISCKQIDKMAQKQQSHNLRTIVIRAIEDRYEESEKRLKVRKRTGDLDVADTISDESICCVWHHWVIYGMIAVTVFFLGLGAYYQTVEYPRIKEEFTDIIALENHKVRLTTDAIIAKIYLRGSSSTSSSFTPALAQAVLLYQTPTIFDLPSRLRIAGTDYSAQQPSCNAPSSPFHAKYCRFAYSYRELEDEAFTLFRSLFEEKVLTGDTNWADLFEKTLYAQTLVTRMEDMIDEYKNQRLRQMSEQSEDHETVKIIVLGMSCACLGGCLLVGLAILLSMKDNYFKEVYMITFLNNQMIFKNKRVESYLHSLAKSKP